MHFEFATATRIIFGPGTLVQVGSLVSEMGMNALVVRGGSGERCAPLMDIFTKFNIVASQFVVQREPTIGNVHIGVAEARKLRSDFVVGIGGGSVIDAGKAIAALLTNEGDVFDYLEVVGRGMPLANPSAPYIAIPTTAGTGAEVTRNAVLYSPEHHTKVSLRSPLMLPRLALIDPELTYSMPPEITATTGLDALTQLIEPYVSKYSNPLVDIVCREGMHRAARSLSHVYEDGDDAASRNDMALVSLFGGLALANAKLGAVHGFAGPLGGLIHAPHGALCARLLPFVMDVNLCALKDRSSDNKYVRRYNVVAQILTGIDSAKAEDGVTWIADLCHTLGIPPLRNFGLTSAHFPEAIESAKNSSSMRGNPIELSTGELHEILERAL